jgi:hypothetical protein
MALPRRDRRDRLNEFFEDSHGFYSMTRLAFFLTTLTSVFVVGWCTVKGTPDDAIGTVGVLQGIGFVGKVAQKQVEEQGNSIE